MLRCRQSPCLRFTAVGAKQTATGCLAPRYDSLLRLAYDKPSFVKLQSYLLTVPKSFSSFFSEELFLILCCHDTERFILLHTVSLLRKIRSVGSEGSPF